YDSWRESVKRTKSLAIIHLAGKAHDTSNTSASAEYFKVNRDLTIELFDVFLRSDVRDFFFISSVKAVADTVVGDLVEDAKPFPRTDYGKSKLEAEKYILAQKLPRGKRMFIIRPCMIHGPGNKGNLNLLYNVVRMGIPWPLASYDNRRSFLSVDNFNYLIESMLLNVNVKSGIYNFSDDHSLSTNDLIVLMADTLNKKANLWHLPKAFINIVAKIGDVIPIPINSERLRKLTESYVVSNDKIKAELKIDTLPVNCKDGLKNTVQSFFIS